MHYERKLAVSKMEVHSIGADHVQNCRPFCYLGLEIGDFDQLGFENKRVFTIFLSKAMQINVV